MVQMAKANGVRRYRHVLRRDDGHFLRKALEFEVKGKRKRGRPNDDVEDASGEGEQECWIGGKGCHRARWRVGVRDCCQSGVNLAIPVYKCIYGGKLGSKLD